MKSRERMLNAIHLQPVDHIPLYLRFWSMREGQDNIPFDWQNQISRAESLLHLGVDDSLLLEPPGGYPENYDAGCSSGVLKTHVTVQTPVKKGGCPILKKEYHTPLGVLTQSVNQTSDWPHGNDIHLFDDFNIPRYVEPLIKSQKDISALKYLLSDPTSEQLIDFQKQSQLLHSEANRLGTLLDGGWSALGDAIIWLCGMENVLYWQMDQPELLEEICDILLEWELKRLDVLLQNNIDVMVHMAWYEGTDFWTPKNYRRILKPRLQQIIDKAHASHIPFRYIITKGWKPIRKDLLEMGVDCICGVDPVQDQLDLQEVKEALGHQICLMGGINAAVMLTQWSNEQIKQSIEQAISILSPGNGFILFPVDNIYCELPWEKVDLIIEYWKRCTGNQ